MEDTIRLIRKKTQLLYDINCVKRYIEEGAFDNNLKNAWDGLNKELEEVTKELDEIKKPQIQGYEKRKIELLNQLHQYEEKMNKVKLELQEVDKLILNINQ